MWVGIVLLANLSWTVSLMGTAAIILAVQGTLYFRGERLDVFMAAVGIVLLIGAVTDIYGSVWSLFPALLIVIGIAMLADALRARPGDRGAGDRPEEKGPIGLV
jgi:hypothetical protein